MKNRNIQFKPTAGLLIPLLLACFAAVLISAPTPATAGDLVPFNGTVSGFIDFDHSDFNTDPCNPSIQVVNFGNAAELGAFTGTAEFFPHFCDPDPDLPPGNVPYTGFFHWIAANGDKLEGTFDGYLLYSGTGQVFNNFETADVTGNSSTGRFFGATGHFTLGGQLDFATASFVLPWQGYISTVGSNKK